jgi:hypothetical protein
MEKGKQMSMCNNMAVKYFRKIKHCADNLGKRIQEGFSPEDAWNMTSIELVQCAEVSPLLENCYGKSVLKYKFKILNDDDGDGDGHGDDDDYHLMVQCQFTYFKLPENPILGISVHELL